MNKLSQLLTSSSAMSPAAKPLSALMHGLGDFTADVEISGISDDTRCLQTGDAFLCLPRVADADLMVQQAVKQGAVAVVLVGQQLDVVANIPVAHLPDMQAAGLWLRRWFDTEDCSIPCIGITGTDGKTSTAWMLREVLAKQRGSAWSCGTLGLVKSADDILDLGNTTPSLLTLHTLLSLAVQENIGALVLEVSSHGRAQERIAGLPFSAAIWTTLGHDHLQDHGGFAAYQACKAGFVAQVAAQGGVVVANGDYAHIQTSLQAVSGAVYWYAHNKKADILWSVSPAGLVLTDNKAEIELTHVPVADFHAENLAAVALLVKALLDIPLSQFTAFDGALSTPIGRLEPVGKQHHVYIDYAHTAEGLSRCLHSARALTSGRLLLVFGCGGDRDKGKRPEMGVAALLADECWLTSDNPRSEQQADIADDVLNGMQDDLEKVHVCPDRKLAIGQAIALLDVEDVLVIAGKGHESYMAVMGERLPWSDKEEALAALASLASDEVKQCV
ncbi:MAG: UDP-N-acetylmuramoyl-L-alanyl-D-glutamate--2,6-diaminopimelate ligase [Ghiorsea sp.]